MLPNNHLHTLLFLVHLVRISAFCISTSHLRVPVRWNRNGIIGLRLSGSVEKDFAQAAATIVPKNVLGGTMQCCCIEPKTGFYRDGFCTTGRIKLIQFDFEPYMTIYYILQGQKT